MADPQKDTWRSVEKVYSCTGESPQECLAAFIDEQATNEAYEVVALAVCASMVVADPKLQALRFKKYGRHPSFIATRERLLQEVRKYPRRPESLCPVALGENAYGTQWLGTKD
jgi:hypothetical protein